ncbi:MAG: ASKHA domain-containing protein [Thermodesulfobacteriota bacterium]
MASHKVRFLPDQVSVEAEDGDNLLQTAMRAGVHVNASCGGEGVCGKCRVILEQGELESPRTEQISPADYETGYRQACQAWIRGDTVIRIPVESQLDGRALERARPGRNALQQAQEIGVERLKAENKFEPPLVKKLVKVQPPQKGDNISDLTRTIRALRAQHRVHNLNVDFKVIKSLPRVMREGGFETTITLAYPPSFLRDGESSRINLVNIQPGDHTRSHYALAVDIGTTTVWVQFLDLITGEVLDTAGDFNRQISYGEDVISRMVYCGKEGGLQKMQALAVSTINGLIARLAKRRNIDREDISLITAAGNTTMTQLFLEVDPRYIRLSPYVPTANYYPTMRAAYLGLAVGEHVMINVFPAVASYVGGDIVAGILASDVYRRPELTLYIDLGTNGEIVIGNQDWMVCAACSAGPAFEGGGVKFGMRATAGAIEDFAVNPKTLEPMILTVDMKKPKGICGSGLINTVAGLFEMDLIDERGKFDRNLGSERIRAGDDGWEYVLSWAGENQVGRDIVLTEVDIDNLIRAKAAMYAGYQCLLESVGLTMSDLDRVIVAGGFGRYINLEKAVTIGLLPELPLDKFTFIGNGSLIGARLACLSNHLRREVMDIVGKMTSFELSEVPTYMDYYVAAQFLPHTKRELFPGVVERLTRTRPLASRIGPS